jgi:NADH-quinone oxidoreductase subunit J
MWVLPSILAAILLAIFIYVLKVFQSGRTSPEIIPAKQVGVTLFSTYLIAVEISAVLMLAGIVGAYHIGKRKKKVIQRFLAKPSSEKTEFDNNTEEQEY